VGTKALQLGVTAITDAPVESLSDLEFLSFEGLSVISDAQSRSLAKIELVGTDRDSRSLIDNYKKQSSSNP
jgi:hypothetical protein